MTFWIFGFKNPTLKKIKVEIIIFKNKMLFIKNSWINFNDIFKRYLYKILKSILRYFDEMNLVGSFLNTSSLIDYEKMKKTTENKSIFLK